MPFLQATFGKMALADRETTARRTHLLDIYVLAVTSRERFPFSSIGDKRQGC